MKNNDNVSSGLPVPRKFSERLKYDKTFNSILREADKFTNDAETYSGMVRLNCALAGMELIPYNNLGIMDRESHWRYVLLSDGEYWVVPYNDFYKEKSC